MLRFRLLICLLAVLAHGPAQGTDASPSPLKIYDDWGGDFTLTDQHGIQLRLGDLHGKIILLSFGYTHCPDICPTTLFTFQRVLRQLGSDAERVQGVFITLDPERDTPQRLADYLDYFQAGFIGLTGSVDEIRAIATRYGTRFEKESVPGSEDYSIAHNGILYLLDHRGRIRVFFRISATPADITPAIRQLLSENNAAE